MSATGGSGAARVRDAAIVLALAAALLLALEGLARWPEPGGEPPLAPKPPGTFRIVALGGSTVLGVPDGAQGFVAQLERLLRRAAPGRALEVVNLARPGAGSRSVLTAADRALASTPDLLIVLTGHNEYLEPDPTALQRLRERSRLARRLGAWLEREPGAEEAFPERIPAVDPDGREARRRRRAYESNLATLVDRAGQAGVPLLLCTAPSNLADWPPAWRRVEGAPGEASVAALRGLLAAGRFEETLAAASEQRESRGDDAMLRFLEGEALHAMGLPDDARARFAMARERDPVPRRAFEAFNDAVRGHAGAPGVRVVDVARRFEDHARHGLVGFELVCDNCHPTPLGHALIAWEIALAMREAGLLLPGDAEIPPPGALLRQLAQDLGDAESRARRQLRWLLSNAIYSMKTPFFHFEAAHGYLERALAIAPNDWRVHANLGTIALLTGDVAAGRRHLARAEGIRGRPLHPDDRAVTPYLAEALARLATAAADAGGS